jgi:aryl-alcohol dehydrogenase-like predicted oxidoreductase
MVLYDTSNEATRSIVGRVEELSQKKGVSMAQISVAWLLSRDVLSAPIIGTTSLDNLRDIVGTCFVPLLSDSVGPLC